MTSCEFHTGEGPLTDANDNKSCHSIEDSQVPHAEHNMVQEKSHEAAQSDARQSEESQKHCQDQPETLVNTWTVYKDQYKGSYSDK